MGSWTWTPGPAGKGVQLSGMASFPAGRLVIIGSGPSPDMDCQGVESWAKLGGGVRADGVDSRHIEREPLGNDRGDIAGWFLVSTATPGNCHRWDASVVECDLDR